MPIGEICSREVIVVQRSDSVLEAPKLMRRHHVGDVVVVDERDGIRIPVGLITDRDVVVEIIATELDPGVITVEDIMEPDLACARDTTGLFETIQYMQDRKVRRLPIVDERGALLGILSLDDLLELLSEELVAMAKLVRYQQQKETRFRQ